MDPNGSGGGSSANSNAATTTASQWSYANPNGAQNYANPAVTTAQSYGNAQTAQNYASAINWWQQQAQAHAQQLAQQQAQALQPQTTGSSQASQANSQQQQAQPQPQAPQQQATQQSGSPTLQAQQGSSQPQQQTSQTHQQQQLSNMNMYQYNQQLLQYQYQQLQSANYQHHTGGAANFAGSGGAAQTPAVTYNDKMPAARSPAKGGKRKRKDPNRPKRPTSAYFFFVSRQRKLCEERGEKITRVAQWTKDISVVWRALTPEEKVPFDLKAAADKERYQREMGKYKNKDPNRPKRPMSAYFLWLADFRLKMKTKIPENKELLRAAGENWKLLTETEKSPYERLAEEERKKYEVKMREYSQGGLAKKPRDEDSLPIHAEGIRPQMPINAEGIRPQMSINAEGIRPQMPMMMMPGMQQHMAPHMDTKNGVNDVDDDEDDDDDDDDDELDDE